jgi:hypothetical protein
MIDSFAYKNEPMKYFDEKDHFDDRMALSLRGGTIAEAREDSEGHPFLIEIQDEVSEYYNFALNLETAEKLINALQKAVNDIKGKKDKYAIKIPIGDWSNDGHSQCEIITISSNYPVEDLQNAYKASCKLTGVQLNHNEDYTGLGIGRKYGHKRLICTEYEESCISSEALGILRDHGLKDRALIEDGYFEGIEHFTEILLWFISLSLPNDFEYEYTRQDGEYLNGFWNDNLNVQFGYGLF